MPFTCTNKGLNPVAQRQPPLTDVNMIQMVQVYRPFCTPSRQRSLLRIPRHNIPIWIKPDHAWIIFSCWIEELGDLLPNTVLGSTRTPIFVHEREMVALSS